MATLCDSGAVKLAAGVLSNEIDLTNTQYNSLIEAAEGDLCGIAKYDFVTNYASLSTVGKQFLTDGCASMAAINLIQIDPGQWSARTAETKLDVCYTRYTELTKKIKDKEFVDFIINGE